MIYETNIANAYRKATAADLAQGLEWYDLARSIADAQAESADLSTEQVAGVIAALSPMNAWGTNIMMAERLIARYLRAPHRRPHVGYGLSANVVKAWRILKGEAPLDVLRGKKVRAFYANIMGDETAVTVDRWAVRIANDEPTHRGEVSTREYDVIARAYRYAAEMLSVSPRTVQAATWTYYRRVHGKETKGTSPS